MTMKLMTVRQWKWSVCEKLVMHAYGMKCGVVVKINLNYYSLWFLSVQSWASLVRSVQWWSVHTLTLYYIIVITIAQHQPKKAKKCPKGQPSRSKNHETVNLFKGDKGRGKGCINAFQMQHKLTHALRSRLRRFWDGVGRSSATCVEIPVRVGNSVFWSFLVCSGQPWAEAGHSDSYLDSLKRLHTIP